MGPEDLPAQPSRGDQKTSDKNSASKLNDAIAPQRCMMRGYDLSQVAHIRAYARKEDL
jgi:hypothetical protein